MENNSVKKYKFGMECAEEVYLFLSDIYYKNLDFFGFKNLVEEKENYVSINFLTYSIMKEKISNGIIVKNNTIILDRDNKLFALNKREKLSREEVSILYTINVSSRREDTYFEHKILKLIVNIMLGLIPEKLIDKFKKDCKETFKNDKDNNTYLKWFDIESFVKFIVTKIFMKKYSYLILKRRIQKKLREHIIDEDVIKTMYKINQGIYNKITMYDYIYASNNINKIVEFSEEYPNLICLAKTNNANVFQKDYLSSKKRVLKIEDIIEQANEIHFIPNPLFLSKISLNYFKTMKPKSAKLFIELSKNNLLLFAVLIEMLSKTYNKEKPNYSLFRYYCSTIGNSSSLYNILIELTNNSKNINDTNLFYIFRAWFNYINKEYSKLSSEVKRKPNDVIEALDGNIIINKISDIFDWWYDQCVLNEVKINKHTSFETICRYEYEWLLKNRFDYNEKMKENNWQMPFKELEINDYLIKAIDNEHSLALESFEMKHCIYYNYLHNCENPNNNYLAFSIFNKKYENKRCTLGMHYDRNKNKFVIDQIRGYLNKDVNLDPRVDKLIKNKDYYEKHKKNIINLDKFVVDSIVDICNKN